MILPSETTVSTSPNGTNGKEPQLQASSLYAIEALAKENAELTSRIESVESRIQALLQEPAPPAGSCGTLTKEKLALAPATISPPRSCAHDIFLVSRQGIIAVEKWRRGSEQDYQDFFRATIYPNEASVLIPAGWYYQVSNPNGETSATLEIFHFWKS